MQRLSLRGLIIDKKSVDTVGLKRAFLPEFELEPMLHANSMHKAFQIYLDEKIDLCIIADSFTMDEARTFLADASKVADSACIMVQMREKMSADIVRQSLQSRGIATIISSRLTDADRESLVEVFQSRFRDLEIKKRVVDVGDAMELLFAEIDRVAAERQRGRDTPLKSISMGFINLQTQFDEKVLDRYFETLAATIEKAEPAKSSKLEMPDRILKRNLPKLTKDKYGGASHRVWKRLLEKHGNASPAGTAASTESADPRQTGNSEETEE